MERLKKFLVMEMVRHQDILLYEIRRGALSIEATLREEVGEISYLLFMRKEDVEQAVKEAVRKIFGEKVKVFDIYKMDRTVFFTIARTES